jgi:ADP-heptose:LPS heptosyltransferase
MTDRPTRRVVLNIGFSPGDIVVFTGAVRDLKLAHPEIHLSVESCCPAIFEANPHLQKPPDNYKRPEIVPNADNLNALGYDISRDFGELFSELLREHRVAAKLDESTRTWNYYDLKHVDEPEGVLYSTKQSTDAAPSFEYYDVHYSDIHNCGWSGRHFSTAYHMELEQLLNLKIPQTDLLPDLHLSEKEQGWMNQVEQETGYRGAFWLINAGHKADYPLKQWGFQRWQELVYMLRNEIQFVQVGETSEGHTHPYLKGVIDLRGKTDLREFIRLTYHAEGAVTPVSLLMHAMAAWKKPRYKPCVVIAGGREPWRWEAYPHHQYAHTCGCLPCCDYNGCWLSGRKDDHGENKTCKDIVSGSAKCMALITPEHIAERVLWYKRGGTA